MFRNAFAFAWHPPADVPYAKSLLLVDQYFKNSRDSGYLFQSTLLPDAFSDADEVIATQG